MSLEINPLRFIFPIEDQKPLPNNLCRVVAGYLIDPHLENQMTFLFCKHIPYFFEELSRTQLSMIAQQKKYSKDPTLIHMEIVRRFQNLEISDFDNNPYTIRPCIKIAVYWSSKFQLQRPAIQYNNDLDQEYVLGLIGGGHLQQLKGALDGVLEKTYLTANPLEAYVLARFDTKLFGEAARSGNIPIFDFLYDRIKIAPSHFQEIWINALTIAARKGNFKMIKHMVKKHPFGDHTRYEAFCVGRAAIGAGHFNIAFPIFHLAEPFADQALYQDHLETTLLKGVQYAIMKVMENNQPEGSKMKDLDTINEFINTNHRINAYLVGMNIEEPLRWAKERDFKALHAWLLRFGRKHRCVEV